MKEIKYRNPLIALFAAIMIVWSISCNRDLDELELAKFPSTPEVFIDGFSAGLQYAAFGGSKVTAFDVDNDVRYSGSSSMKIEIPDAGDPQGSYAGGVYSTSVARDLSSFDALTFWAKASKAASVDLVGFGNDLGESKYLVSLRGMKVNSNWKKYIIPIPDPGKLTQEKGMFYYSEGPEDGSGYTLWIDEVKFEKLGTIAHKKPMILDGNEVTESTVNSLSLQISGLSMSVNLPTGIDQTVQIAPAWFSFASSDAGVATVDAKGTVLVLSEGTTKITATSGGTEASGSMTVTSTGDYIHAPVPDKAAEDVISIFSNAYTNVPVDFYNGFWEPYQTTLSSDFKINNDDVLNYTNFNFVGIQFTSPAINASDMTHLHMDIWIPNAVAPGDKLSVKVVDMGPDGSLNGTDPSITYEIPGPMASKSWISSEISLAGLTSKSKLAQIILEKIGTGPTGFYLDNVYFYKEEGGTGPAAAAPAPPARNASDVVSLFSGAYTNLTGTDFNPNWGQSTVVSTEDIVGNSTLKYASFNYQGTGLSAPQDLTGMQFLHIDMWTADATVVGVTPINSTGSPPEHLVNLSPINAGQWNSYDIPLTAFTSSGMSLNQVFQMKFDGQAGKTPSTIYLDNIYFYRTGSPPTEPTSAAPAPPARNVADVISLFSNAYTNVTVNTWRTDWSAATLEEVSIAGNAAKKYSALDFVGIETNPNTVDATEMTHVHLDVWSADITRFSIKLVDFGADGAYGGANDVEHQLDFASPAQGVWVSYDIPLSNFTGLTTRAHLAQYILAGQPVGATTIWMDNFYFYKESGGTTGGPASAAPTPPARNVTDVISFFSNAYTNVFVDAWSATWDDSDVADLKVEGNDVKKYTFTNFAGIDFSSHKLNASAMTGFHLDIWTPDNIVPGDVLTLKCVDFGGGSAEASNFILTVVHTASGSIPALEKGKWISIDLPVTAFSGTLTRSDLAQIVLTCTLNTLYFDNMYFYK